MENNNDNKNTETNDKKNNPVMDSLHNIKNNIESFAKEANFSQFQHTVKNMIKDAQKDFSKLVTKDLAEVKTKFEKEKNQLEKKFSSLLVKELTQAKKFMNNQKKEIEVLQKKIEKLITDKKKTVKSVVKKKTIKKVSKKK